MLPFGEKLDTSLRARPTQRFAMNNVDVLRAKREMRTGKVRGSKLELGVCAEANP